MVLAKPGSIKPHTEFDAEVYVLKKEEGGRHTPFFNGYRPQFFIRTLDVTGDIKLPRGGGDGDAGRQHQDACEIDCAGGVGKWVAGLRFGKVDARSVPVSLPK